MFKTVKYINWQAEKYDDYKANPVLIIACHGKKYIKYECQHWYQRHKWDLEAQQHVHIGVLLAQQTKQEKNYNIDKNH